jgi:hypothetical protein
MSRRLGLALLVGLLAAAPATAAPPREGVLDPGRSLGGIRLGDSAAQVLARFGRARGVCKGCRVRTWYFTYRPYEQQGVGVELERGRVAAIFTLWSPRGWRTTGGVELGTPEQALPALRSVRCRGYRALLARSPQAVTAYYVVDGKLWGFGLQRPTAQICR